MKPLAPNTLLQNRYLVVHLIGKGGMGEVYLAVDQRLGSAVALKRTFFSGEEVLENAFEREARTLARLRHPVLPKVSDHFIENDNQYLIMEHISGEDLSKRLESSGKPFPVNWVLFWADQLLDALHYLHSHEPPIIHRDIKPQNLKLTDENHVVLLDFGLSKNTVGQTHLSISGGVSGFTPHYAPMEQVRGTGTGARSDIYSLSATLYQLLTNNVPLDALSRADSLLNGMEDPVVPIHEINNEVAKPISDIILKGMSVSQEQRYASAREMQKALRDAYSRLQSAMSAQTVAFNLDGDGNVQQPVRQPSEINQFATLVDVSTSRDAGISSANSENEDFSADKTEVMDLSELSSVEKGSGEEKLDSAPRAHASDSQPQSSNSQPKQADIKTEVFLANELSGEASSDDERDDGGSFSPEETLPLVAYESQPKKTREVEIGNFERSGADNAESDSSDAAIPQDFDEDYDRENGSEEIGYGLTENYSDSDDAETVSEVEAEEDYETEAAPQPYPNAAAASENKSSKKAFLILGGLFAFFVITIGSAIGGWYAYKNYAAAKDATPTPAVSPSVAPTPAAPTPEPTMEAQIPTESTNSALATDGNLDANSLGSGAANSSGDGANDSPRQTTRPTPARTAVPRSTPQVVTAKTPKPTPEVKKTPTPKKKPEILQ